LTVWPLYVHFVNEFVMTQRREPLVVLIWNSWLVEKYFMYVIWPTSDAVVDIVLRDESGDTGTSNGTVLSGVEISGETGGVVPDCPPQPVTKSESPSTPTSAKARSKRMRTSP
jgi:hypothetical protein